MASADLGIRYAGHGESVSPLNRQGRLCEQNREVKSNIKTRN